MINRQPASILFWSSHIRHFISLKNNDFIVLVIWKIVGCGQTNHSTTDYNYCFVFLFQRAKVKFSWFVYQVMVAVVPVKN